MSDISSEIERYTQMLQDEKKRLTTSIKALAYTSYSFVINMSPYPAGTFSTGMFKGNNVFSVNGAKFELYPVIRNPSDILAGAVNSMNSVSNITSFHITNSSDYAQNVENTGWQLTPPYAPYKKTEDFIVSQIDEAFNDLKVVRK